MRTSGRTIRTFAFALAAVAAAIATTNVRDAIGQGASRFPDVVAALRATPGCLGVETAQTPALLWAIPRR